MRKVIFRNTVTGEELILPVTPLPLEGEMSVSMEVFNISGLGDVATVGNGALASLSLTFLLPAQRYPFCSVAPNEPYSYVEKLEKWMSAGSPVRYIWSGTPFNRPVLLESVRHIEDDGSGDLTCTLTMREYRQPEAPVDTSAGQVTEPPRAEEPEPEGERIHTVVWGDTLSAICLAYYGKAALYPQVAAYNGIKNPNIIHPGDLIKLPDVSVLSSMTVTGGYGSYSPAKAPTLPPKAAAKYNDKVLAMKERQAHG